MVTEVCQQPTEEAPSTAQLKLIVAAERRAYAKFAQTAEELALNEVPAATISESGA